MPKVYPFIAFVAALAACSKSGEPNVDTALIERLYRSVVTGYACDGTQCTYMVARGQLVIDVRKSASADWAAIEAGGVILSGSHERKTADGDELVSQSLGQLIYVRRGSYYVTVDMRAAPHNARIDGPLLAADALRRVQMSR